jgi:hypothetical protein
MFAYPQYSPQMPQPTTFAPQQYPQMMPTQPQSQPNPYLAQMQAMQAQMMAMQQHMASMQASVAAAPAAKKARKPRTPKDPNAPKQPIPEGTSAWISYVQLIRGEIDARMKSVDPTYKGVSWKDAMSEAKRLKDLGDPRYQYTPKPKAPAAPKQAIPQLPLPAPSISLPFPIATPADPELLKSLMGAGYTPEAFAEIMAKNSPAAATTPAPKKVVRKAAAAPAPIPTASVELISFPAPVAAPSVFAMAPMQEAIEEASNEDLVLEEETINGIAYLMSPKKECWLMEADGSQGAWAGVYNGTTIDDSIPEPEY